MNVKSPEELEVLKQNADKAVELANNELFNTIMNSVNEHILKSVCDSEDAAKAAFFKLQVIRLVEGALNGIIGDYRTALADAEVAAEQAELEAEEAKNTKF